MDRLAQTWNNYWSTRTVEHELNMGDFYGGRQFILKYLPRQGSILEAGCGLGRYVIYLSCMGFKIVGSEISHIALDKCREWAIAHGYDANSFRYADVRDLPFPNDHFTGYLSLGVIEHFKEGPEKALEEAFRVLKSGGIAVVSTPNKHSAEVLFYGALRLIKAPIKFLLSLIRLYSPKRNNGVFFQYEYSANELADYVKNAGFNIIEKTVIDIKYPIYELFRHYGKLAIFHKLKSSIFLCARLLERSFLKFVGGLSMVVAYKPGPETGCFICGAPCQRCVSLTIAVCRKCLTSIPDEIIAAYRTWKKTYFNSRSASKSRTSGVRKCSFCHGRYENLGRVGDDGFSINVCPNCLRNPITNLQLSTIYIEEDWHERD